MLSATRLVGPAIGLILLAVGLIGLTGITSATDSENFISPQARTPTEVSLTPAESWSCILDQQELTALLMDDRGAVGNGRIEFILNRFPQAVGDIVEVGGNSPTKRTNTFAIVQTDANGEASATLVATRPGDTDVTAFAPGIQDTSVHKVFGVVHWVDGCPQFPSDAENPVGTAHPMSVSVLRVSDGSPVQGASVRWTVTDDPAARFANAPGHGNIITTTTNALGLASVTLEQVLANIGDNSVLIEVLTQDRKTMFAHTMVKQWRSPVLEISATGPATIGLLSEASYDITVTNSGDSRATESVLTMELPAGLRFVSATDGGAVSGPTSDQVATWNLGAIAMGDSVSVSLTAQGVLTGLQISDVSIVSAEGLRAKTTTETRVIPGGLEVTKTGPATATIDSLVTYSIEVLSTGTGANTGVELVDTVPAGMSFVSVNMASTSAGNQVTFDLDTLYPAGIQVTFDLDTLYPAGNQVTFDLDTLYPDEEATVQIVLQANQTGAWTNQATVTSAEGATDTAETTTTIVQPVLAITKEGPATALLNTNFDYTITVTNNGDGVATSPRVVDTLPAGLKYVSSDPEGTASGSTVTWNIDDLAPDAFAIITLTVEGVSLGPQENVTIASSGGNTFQPEARATTNILEPAITIEKTGRSAMFVGNQVTYTLTASNSGDAALTSVTITDTVPAGMTYISSSPAGTVSEDGTQITWNVGSLALRAESSVMVTLRADEEGTVINTATANADEGATDTTTLDIRVLPAPGATIQMTDSVDPVSEGEQVEFTVMVSNQGRSDMTGVRVVVPIPAAMTIVSTSDDQATVSADGSTVTFELDGPLPTGESFSFTIMVEANELPSGDIRKDTVTTATLNYNEFSLPVSANEGTTVIEE